MGDSTRSRSGILYRSRQQAELVALGISQHHPGDVRRLTHIDRRSAQLEQALKLLGGRHTIGPEVKMQSVLHALDLRNGQNVDHRPRAVWRSDAHPPVGLLNDLPPEDRAPELSHNPGVHGVYDNAGKSTRHIWTIPIASDPAHNRYMPQICTRAITSAEFEALRNRMIREYAAAHVAAGNWTVEEAEKRAAEQTDQLLPQGVDTPGVLMLVAETPEGKAIGHLWLALERQPGNGGGAWIYDIEILPEHRGQGYGRALLGAAEDAAARHDVDSIGLNVFGTNRVARNLYQSAGYTVATMQMRKVLHSAADGGEDR
jgi:ribosomal protein S18 acetylase RimI-like enzyme